MGMTIEDAMNHIKYGIIENNYPLQRDLGIEACNVALDTMRKYQKIEELVNGWGRYRKGVSSSVGDSVYMQKVSEVIENGTINSSDCN